VCDAAFPTRMPTSMPGRPVMMAMAGVDGRPGGWFFYQTVPRATRRGYGMAEVKSVLWLDPRDGLEHAKSTTAAGRASDVNKNSKRKRCNGRYSIRRRQESR
jgi:hypothetical protein